MSTTENKSGPPRKRGRGERGELPSVKFRASCDSCAEAKVRCDKRRPQCGRCIRVDSNCRYGVSMRTGKSTMDLIRSLSADSSLGLPQQVEGTGSLDPDELLQAILQMEKTQSWNSNASLVPFPSGSLASSSSASSMPYSDHTTSLDLGAELTDSSLSPPQFPNDQSDRISPPQDANFRAIPSDSAGMMGMMGMIDYFCTNVDDFGVPASYTNCPDMVPSMKQGFDLDLFSRIATCTESPAQGDANELLVPMEPSTQSPTSHNEMSAGPTHNLPHSCVQTAKTLQQCLIMMGINDEAMQRKYQSLTGILPTKTTDQALLMCLNISEQIKGILQCHCEGDAYLPFLMTVLISKVLAAYGAIANVDDSTPFGFATITKNRPEEPQQRERDDTSQESQSAGFLAVPLRLGAYDIDGELEGLLRAQLVLHELCKLEPIVGLFAEKYCGEGSADDLNEAEHKTVYFALSQFVRHRYERTREVCERRCNRAL